MTGGNAGYIGGIQGFVENSSGSSYVDCHNYGNISFKDTELEYNGIFNIGGIVGKGQYLYGDLVNCSNNGNIIAYGGTQIGGLCGYMYNGNDERCVSNSYNTGDIYGANNIAGISVGSVGLKDVANYGNIIFTEPSYIGGISTIRNNDDTKPTITNAINFGTLYYNGTEDSYTEISSIGKVTSGSRNMFYLDKTVEKLRYFTERVGTRETHDELCSQEFYNTINTNDAWVYNEGDYPTLKIPTTVDNRAITEVTVYNKLKKFKITTRVEMYHGYYGGTISGETENPYETVEYNENSTKQIVITPDTGYEIMGITINGVSQSFRPNSDGTYTLPRFANMQEDKDIVVTFKSAEQKLKVTKVDESTREPLSGAQFKFEKKTELALSRFSTQYYFPYNSQTGQYISDNKNVDDSIATSFVYIHINVYGNYYVEVNASISSEKNKDIGYVTLSRGQPTYEHGNDTDIWEFMNISGEVDSKTYKTRIFNYSSGNTQPYFINCVYQKDSQNSVGDDEFVINSIKVYNADTAITTDETDYDGETFVELTQGDYRITEIKSPEGYSSRSAPIEFTYSPTGEQEITIENTKAPIVNVNHYLWTSQSGVTDTKVSDSLEVRGEIGDNYSTSPDFDIEYELVRNRDYYRNKSQTEILNILGKNSIEEAGYSGWEDFYDDYYIPQNASGTFAQTNDDVNFYYKEKTYTLTVKHLLEGTEQNVPNKTGGTVADEITDGYLKNAQYNTNQSSSVDYTKYELVAIPDNKNGTILSDTEVKYYYRLKESAGIIVHHYIVGTENRVPNDSGGVVSDEIMPENTTVNVGESYTTNNAEDRIAVNYRVATYKDVYGDSIPDGKTDTDNYEPENMNGLYTDEVQEIIYFYALETPVHTSSISKTGTESISREDERVNYTIDYEVQIQDYIGNATVQIVDQLPYKIDVSKSSLNGGEYNDTNKTITWRELRNIDTYNNSSSGDLTLSKSISVVFKNYDYTKHTMTNTVQGNTTLLESNTTTDTVQSSSETSYRFLRNITVNKVWNDNDNELGIRPNSIDVTLNAQDYEIPSGVGTEVELSGPNWTYTWPDLEKYDDDGHEIIYNVVEHMSDSSDVVYTSNTTTSNDIYTITNTYTAPTDLINLTVKKTWQDNNDENEKRPEEIKLELYKQGEGNNKTKINEYTLDVETESSYTFTNLLKYDEIGNRITYLVEEKEVNENDLIMYQTSVGNIEEKSDTLYEINVTNTFSVPDERINITANKVWVDNNNQNNKRPNKVKIVLSKPKVGQEGLDIVDEYELNVQNNETSHIFENVNKYDLRGNIINYIVTEEEVTTDDLKFYTKQISDITNNVCTITNTFTVPSEQISINVRKIWNDNENSANKRPTGVTIKLMNGQNVVMTDVANSSNSWEVTFNALAKYNSQGNEINYTVKEQEITQGDLYFYSDGVVTGNKSTGYAITNTFTVPDEKIQIPDTKTWNDNNKNRISSVELVLTGNDNTYRHTLTEANKLSTNSNVWSYVFTDLPKYNSNGDEISYTLSENEVTTGDLNKYIQAINEYNVTNALVINDTSIEKTGTNSITSLEDRVEYTLNYTVDINSNYTDGATITIVDTLPYEIDETKEYNLNGGTYNSDNKTITWTNNYSGENSITKNISLVYKNIDLTKTKLTNNVKGTLQLSNGYEEEVTNVFDTTINFKKTITVNKVWLGDFRINQNNNVEISNTRPNKVTVELNSLDNNVLTKLQEKDITQNSNWEISFENLPKYDTTTRKEINYQITENNVPDGYYCNIVQNDNTFTVTNSKYGSIKITKVDSIDNTVKLGGAEFKLEKLKNVGGEMVIDENFDARTTTSSSATDTLGKVEFENLEYGTYRLTETKAPEGYNLLRTSTDIEITSDNTDYIGVLSNKEKTALPVTGGFGRNILIISGALIIIILILIKKKRIYIVRI